MCFWQLFFSFNRILNKLEELTLSSNQLVGNIPFEIGKLKSLKKLALNSNTLAGHLPSEIETLENLKWVND